MRMPGSQCKYIPDNPETDEQMVMSETKVAILQVLRQQPEALYDVLVIAGPFNGHRMTANESDLTDLS